MLSDAGVDTDADANADSGAGFDAAVDVAAGSSTAVPLSGDPNGSGWRPFSAQGFAPTFAEIVTIRIHGMSNILVVSFTYKRSRVLFQHHVPVS